MNIYREITPLNPPDVFVVLDSVSNGFDYPIHNHPEYELNLVAGMSGTRIVGDSTERYNDYDLVLLGPYLYHKWDGDAQLQQNGQPYLSPLTFYINNGFTALPHARLENEKISAVKIEWKK